MTVPLSLSELIKASGTTPSAGTSFRSNVIGAGDGVDMLSYRMTDWQWLNGIVPAPGANPGSFPVTTVLTRNSRGGLIQENSANAWFVSLAQNLGVGGSVTINNFSTTDGGATHNFNINISPGVSGNAVLSITPSPIIWISFGGANGTTTFGTIASGGSSDIVTLRIGLQWRPDKNGAIFNPYVPRFEDGASIPQGAGRPAAVAAKDILVDITRGAPPAPPGEYQWYNTFNDRANGVNIISTNSSLSLGPLTLGASPVLIERFLRWRQVGTSTWNLLTYQINWLGGTPPTTGQVIGNAFVG